MPAQDQLISQYVDRAGIQSDTDFVVSRLKEVDDLFTKLQNTKIRIDNSKNGGDLTQSIKEAVEANNALVVSKQKLIDIDLQAAKQAKVAQDAKTASAFAEQNAAQINLATGKAILKQDQDLIVVAVKSATAQTDKAKAIAIQRDELQKSTAVLKNQVQLQSSEEGSINRARIQVGLLNKERNSLNLTTVEGRKRQEELNKAIDEGNDFIKKNVDSLSAQKINIGNYPEAVQGAINSLHELVGAYLGVGAAEKVIDFLGDSVKKFDESQEAAARLDSTLANIGRSDAIERLKTSAEELKNKFKTFETSDVYGVFEKLIDYGKLTENQISELTPIIVDYAAKQKISLVDGSDAIIKALNGNGKALKEFGINIKAAGSTSENFSQIISELGPKVNGAMEAFGETNQGKIKKTTILVDDLKESIGEKLSPVVLGFYKVLDQALGAIPILFNNVKTGLSDVINSFITLGGLVQAVFQGGPTAAGAYLATLDQINDRITKQAENEKNLANIRKNAKDLVSGIVDDAIKTAAKSGDKQKEIVATLETNLNQQKSLLDDTIKRYTILVNLGKQNTAEGKAMQNQYLKDAEVFHQLQDAIIRQKDTSKLGTGVDKKQINLIDRTTSIEDLKEEQDLQNKLSQITDLGLTTRVNARQKAADAERKIIQTQADDEIENAKRTLTASLTDPNITGNGRINAQNEYNNKVFLTNQKANDQIKKLELDLGEDLVGITTSWKAREYLLTKDYNQQTIQAYADTDAKLIDQAKKLADKRIDNLGIDQDYQLESINRRKEAERTALDQQFNAGLISETKYGLGKLHIQEKYADLSLKVTTDYQTLVLKDQLDFAVTQLALDTKNRRDTTADLKAIEDLKLKIQQAGNAKLLEDQKLHDSKEAELLTQKKALYKEIQNSSVELLGQLGDRAYDAETQALQKQIDLIDQKREKDIEYANSSIQNAQDRAAALTAIDIKANADKEALERQQRKVEADKAKFEKISSSIKVAIDTFQKIAAIKAQAALLLANPITAALAPLAISQIPVVLIAAAIAEAGIASQKIPEYGFGTQYHPQDGPAWLGDRYKKEIGILPDNSWFVSSDKPTQYHLPRGTKVLPDAQQIFNNSFYGAMTPISDNAASVFAPQNKLSDEKLDKLINTVKNKKEIHISGSFGSVLVLHKVAANWNNYIDENIP